MYMHVQFNPFDLEVLGAPRESVQYVQKWLPGDKLARSVSFPANGCLGS